MEFRQGLLIFIAALAEGLRLNDSLLQFKEEYKEVVFQAQCQARCLQKVILLISVFLRS